MEPELRAGLEVQSWLSGWNPLPSTCPPQSMYEYLKFRHMYIREARRGWNTSVDHSKWAITTPETSSGAGRTMPGVCIGDMNRMQAQSYRGGGTVCFMQNPTLWRTFRNIVAAIEGCSPPVPA
ncbi:g5960 [Coccomyxa viridis]|uniref:G5960 protein n=1 Tax=Coccomyxa viridis TaxID=1274662 RepID=A0ABP1G0Z1_9CHLO